MARYASVLLLAVLVAVGGCYSDPGPVTRVSPGPGPSSSAPSPPPPVSEADLRSWVEHAQLTPDVVGAQPPKPVTERSGNDPYKGPCETPIAANGYLVYSHQTYWIGTRIDDLHHDVYAFSAIFGRDALAQAHRVVTGCSEYTLTGPPAFNSNTPTKVHLKVVPDLPLAVPAGTDAAYAYCEISTNITPGHTRESPANICTALVSRRNLMMSIRVVDGPGGGMDEAQRKLAARLPVAVAALVSAVPAG